MTQCDEDDCTEKAAASCGNCGVFLCLDHCGGDGSDCLVCANGVMEAL